MEVYHGYTSDHNAYYVHDLMCKQHTMQPLSYFMTPQRENLNLIVCGDTCMFLECSSGTTVMLVTVYHDDGALPAVLQSYSKSVEDDLETDVLPWSSVFHSVLYLPLFVAGPQGYALTAPRTTRTQFDTALPHVMAEWTRTFAMLPDGRVARDDELDLDIQLPVNEHPVYPADALEALLDEMF